MSRSYKKHPILTQEKEDNNYFNRQIRRDKYAEFSTPGAFKRHRPHWHSWSYIWTKEDAIKDWYEKERSGSFTLEEWLNYWARCVYRK